MLYLVSTEETQKQRKNDFCFVPEGEPLFFGTECDGGTVDDHCGCRRSMCGVKCAESTTTMKVIEIHDDFRHLISDCLTTHYIENWEMGYEDAEKAACRQVTEIELLITGTFKVGDIIERRGNHLRLRKEA